MEPSYPSTLKKAAGIFPCQKTSTSVKVERSLRPTPSLWRYVGELQPQMPWNQMPFHQHVASRLTTVQLEW